MEADSEGVPASASRWRSFFGFDADASKPSTHNHATGHNRPLATGRETTKKEAEYLRTTLRGHRSALVTSLEKRTIDVRMLCMQGTEWDGGNARARQVVRSRLIRLPLSHTDRPEAPAHVALRCPSCSIRRSLAPSALPSCLSACLPAEMSALSTANPRNFGVKRIMKEYSEFQSNESDYFTAAPCDDNLFEWHFTIRGPPDSDFDGGRYHGRILLPSQYVSADSRADRQVLDRSRMSSCSLSSDFLSSFGPSLPSRSSRPTS